jgi:hypothetical protein
MKYMLLAFCAYERMRRCQFWQKGRGVARRVAELIGAFQTTPKTHIVLVEIREENGGTPCRAGDEAEAFINVPALSGSCEPTQLFQQPKTKEMSAGYSPNRLGLFSYTWELQ